MPMQYLLIASGILSIIWAIVELNVGKSFHFWWARSICIVLATTSKDRDSN